MTETGENCQVVSHFSNPTPYIRIENYLSIEISLAAIFVRIVAGYVCMHFFSPQVPGNTMRGQVYMRPYSN